MRNRLSAFYLLAITGAFLVWPQGANAGDPNIIAPYRYEPAPQQLTPLEQQKALIYRNQVQNQLRTLENDDVKGNLNSFDQETLRDTRSELFRMNGVLGN